MHRFCGKDCWSQLARSVCDDLEKKVFILFHHRTLSTVHSQGQAELRQLAYQSKSGCMLYTALARSFSTLWSDNSTHVERHQIFPPVIPGARVPIDSTRLRLCQVLRDSSTHALMVVECPNGIGWCALLGRRPTESLPCKASLL